MPPIQTMEIQVVRSGRISPVAPARDQTSAPTELGIEGMAGSI